MSKKNNKEIDKSYITKQLKDTMAKVEGAKNLLNNGKIPIAANKLLGISQKLGYIVGCLEKNDNNSD
ncbi:MAG: hypothetical protein ACOC56_00555 [Atribacterota bacterium]